MAIVNVQDTAYTVEPVYQWDTNQVLEIYGLNLSAVPEIHFSNSDMERAIVRQATKDAAGVIRADVPNTLLQKPYKIKAHICTYVGDVFETHYCIEIPVKARNKPYNYVFEDTAGEVYSFNDLENKIANYNAEARSILNETVEQAQNMLDALNITTLSRNKKQQINKGYRMVESIDIPANTSAVITVRYESPALGVLNLELTDANYVGGTVYASMSNMPICTAVVANTNDTTLSLYVWANHEEPPIAISGMMSTTYISAIFIPNRAI